MGILNYMYLPCFIYRVLFSVASLSSEVAAALAGSGGSDDVSAMSLTSEAILDIVRPAGNRGRER